MLNNNELLLNKKYDFLRRSVISYYARCSSIDSSDPQSKHDTIPFKDFADAMSFLKDVFYSYLQNEYKEIIKK